MQDTPCGGPDRPQFGDVLIAASLLTRLPVPVNHGFAAVRMASALWAAPLLGAVLGGVTGAGLLAAHAVNLPPLAAAGLAVALSLGLTGALHEDGLADCADGFGGGHTPARRLEIMRDSRLGTYGVAALVLALLLRVVLLAELSPSATMAACVTAGAVSRVPMVWALRLMVPARPGGLGGGVGVPPRWAGWLAVGLPLPLVLAVPGGPLASLAVALAALAIGRAALRAIGGQTGDVLGAMQVAGELAALGVLVTALR